MFLFNPFIYPFIMKIQLSTVSILIVLLTAFFIDLHLKNWEKDERVIEWDVHNYYAYLPLQFIYNDITVNENYRYGDNLYYVWSETTPDGRNVIKGPIGLAYLYAPFFFVAHGIALLSDYPANGYSEPYKIFLLLSSLFFLFLGLDFTKKILLYLSFSEKHVAITLIMIGLGTNLLAYSSILAPLAHVYNFALMAIFIYYTLKWHDKQLVKYILLLSVTLGLITLIRPTNGLIALFFVFYRVDNLGTLKEKIKLFSKHFLILNLFILIGFIIWIPQFWYWKVSTGNYLYYSFKEEGFYFTDPKILEGLFSFRKGWLVYTPLMAFSIVGMFFLKDKLSKLRLPIIAFSVLNIYIIFSWWCWWYGGTFGQRSMIDSYAILSIPLAAFVRYVDEKRIINYIFYSIVLFFIWLNIFQTYQYEFKCLHYDSMSSKLYFKQFGIMHRKVDFEEYLDWADYDAAKYRGNKVKEIPQPVNITSKKVNIIAFNGKYLCAEWDRNIIADKDKAQGWELFTLNIYENNEASILAYDDYLLSADLGMNGEVTATRKEKHSWETFTLEYLETDVIAIKASNGKYWSVNLKTLQIFATADEIGETERFHIQEIN